MSKGEICEFATCNKTARFVSVKDYENSCAGKVRCMRLRCATKLYLSGPFLFNLTLLCKSLFTYKFHLVYLIAVLRCQATYCDVQQNLYVVEFMLYSLYSHIAHLNIDQGTCTELRFIILLAKDLLHIATTRFSLSRIGDSLHSPTKKRFVAYRNQYISLLRKIASSVFQEVCPRMLNSLGKLLSLYLILF